MRTPPEMTCGFLMQLVFCKKKNMSFIGVEVEQETPLPIKKSWIRPRPFTSLCPTRKMMGDPNTLVSHGVSRVLDYLFMYSIQSVLGLSQVRLTPHTLL